MLSAELKMDVLREREVKDSLERQLQDEQKVRGEYAISIPALPAFDYQTPVYRPRKIPSTLFTDACPDQADALYDESSHSRAVGTKRLPRAFPRRDI